MAPRDSAQKFQLKAVPKSVEYDPHLQEEKLRVQTAQEGSRAVTWVNNGKRVVDVIAKLANPARLDELERFNQLDQAVPGLEIVRRPGRKDIVTGWVDCDQVETVRKQPDVLSLKAVKELYVNLHYSVDAIHCDPESLDAFVRDARGQAYPGLNGSGVIVGIVDLGCDFKHENFRHPSGATRILSLWDQSDPPASSTAQGPKGFGYGREFSSTDINQALRAGDGAYEALGYSPAISAHGTHVMDIAAGNGRAPDLFLGKDEGVTPAGVSHPGVAPGASLIFVHLKTEEGEFLGNSRHLLEAVDYIFEKADQLGMPAVVNLSLATSGGPHDGTTLVEQGLEALLTRPGRAIVVSAGNSFEQQSHIRGTVPKGDKAWTAFRWRTDPRAPRNEMEIWYPGGQRLKVRLTAPDGRRFNPVALGETKALWDDEDFVGRISHREKDPNNNDHQIDIRVPHLEGTDQPWKVELQSEGDDVEFHAWIEQDDRGEARFEDLVETSCTLGSICCGASTLTVGAFDTAENAYLAPPYRATSSGPTRRDGKKPEISAPGVQIVAARAFGGTTVMSGTSLAAAHLTGLVALLFQLALKAGKGFLPIQTTREIIIKAARQSSGFAEWDRRLGFGRIDGLRTLEELLSLSVAEEEPGVQDCAESSVEAMSPNAGGNGHKDLHQLVAAMEQQLQQVKDLLVQLQNGNLYQPPYTSSPEDRPAS